MSNEKTEIYDGVNYIYFDVRGVSSKRIKF